MLDYLQLMRCREWIKNLVVFVGPILGLKLFDWTSIWQAWTCFFAFCLVSSSSYAINDVMDREADARHPLKRKRPVARGAISPAAALAFGVLLVVAGMTLSLRLLRMEVADLLGAYFILILGYSSGFKKRIILDVIIIAVGFVLRAWAGAEAVGVATSPWLIACTFTLCLFMGFGKRRCELAAFENVEQATEHRATLARYTPELLNNLTSVSAGIAIVTFLLYTLDPSKPPPFPKQHLLYTLPLVVYGVFRFAMLAQGGKYNGPTEIVLKDRPFAGTIVLWGLIAACIVLGSKIRALAGLG
ncbi:MAG: decaprenyl-phosphate phosphoribosyltransferase [Phycisphaerales bacterium]|nr:MAG: decaprenyl-phosphate phosphoribosyltransferase [Phycisphaerales bacterium]